MSTVLVPSKIIENKFFMIRGQKVMLTGIRELEITNCAFKLVFM